MSKHETAGTRPKRKSVPSAAGAARRSTRVTKQAALRRASEQTAAAKMQQLVALAKKLPAVRLDLIKRVQAEIAAGTYETPDRMDKALDKLLDELADKE
jgi:hypothetical protein